MRLPQLSLLSRVALGLAAVGLLPLAIFSFGLVDLNRDAMVDQVLRTHLVAAESAAVQVAAFVSTRVSLARGAASNPALSDPRSALARGFLAENLGAWADLGVLAVEVTDPRGERVIQAQLRGVQDRAAAALAPDPRLALAATGSGRDLTLRVTAPLPQGAGLLRLVCDGSGLGDLAALSALGSEADLLVAGRGGRVLLGTAPSLAGFPEGLAKVALSGRISGAGRFGAADGEEILGAYAPVADSDWVVVTRQPSRVAEALAVRLRRQSLLAIVAALALTGVLSVFAWRGIVRPVRGLVEAQRRLARLPAAAEAGGDEIGELRRAFEALERSLADRSRIDDVFLGRYQVIEPLGTGAMGSVFRGWDPKLQRPVALKTVRLEPGSDPGKRRSLMETLLREAVTLARLSHPHVVPVFDLEDSPDGAFIAMGLVDGINLETLLWEQGRLGPARAVPLGAAIARALEAAHANGVVHRDIKPANVLLGWDGSIKVSDFGIAELLARLDGDEGKAVVGTPGYVPPETLERGEYGRAGDLFALGVVLYRALRGIHPFAGGTPQEIVRATLTRTVPPLSRSVQDLPPDLDRLIQRLLDKDEALRPADAGAVAAELERIAVAGGYRWSLGLTREDLLPPSPPVPPAPAAAGSTQLLPRARPGERSIPLTRPGS